jgi:hypothetical protein
MTLPVIVLTREQHAEFLEKLVCYPELIHAFQNIQADRRLDWNIGAIHDRRGLIDIEILPALFKIGAISPDSSRKCGWQALASDIRVPEGELKLTEFANIACKNAWIICSDIQDNDSREEAVSAAVSGFYSREDALAMIAELRNVMYKYLSNASLEGGGEFVRMAVAGRIQK